MCLADPWPLSGGDAYGGGFSPSPPQFLESCDEVILLEDGEICEKGTHQELMEKRGRYAKLVHNLRGLQFKVAACV